MMANDVDALDPQQAQQCNIKSVMTKERSTRIRALDTRMGCHQVHRLEVAATRQPIQPEINIHISLPLNLVMIQHDHLNKFPPTPGTCAIFTS